MNITTVFETVSLGLTPNRDTKNICARSLADKAPGYEPGDENRGGFDSCRAYHSRELNSSLFYLVNYESSPL